MTNNRIPSQDKIVSPPVAPEFADYLRAHGLSVLTSWLRENGAPTEVVELASNCDYLGLYLEELKTGPMTEQRARMLGIENAVVSVANAIAALGGKFYDGNSYTMPRENQVRWAAPASGLSAELTNSLPEPMSADMPE